MKFETLSPFRNAIWVAASRMAGFTLTLIFAFDRPFQGDLAIGPEAYILIRDQLMGN